MYTDNPLDEARALSSQYIPSNASSRQSASDYPEHNASSDRKRTGSILPPPRVDFPPAISRSWPGTKPCCWRQTLSEELTLQRKTARHKKKKKKETRLYAPQMETKPTEPNLWRFSARSSFFHVFPVRSWRPDMDGRRVARTWKLSWGV